MMINTQEVTVDHNADVCVLDHVRLIRHNRLVIDDFSLSIERHDFVSLIGANGSGKTTLLRILLGFLKPAAGTVELFGTVSSDIHRFRRRIGYVPQAASIDYKMPMSVRDVVAMGRYGVVGIGRRLNGEDRHIIQNSLRDVGIIHIADRPIGHLSGGEYQKVQLARALCQTPDLLLLDEPTSNLDLGAQKECLDLIMKLHELHDLTTIIVMHDLKSLPPICNRAIIIDEGRKVYDGPFADVLNEVNIAHVYKHQTPEVLRGIIENIAKTRNMSC